MFATTSWRVVLAGTNSCTCGTICARVRALHRCTRMPARGRTEARAPAPRARCDTSGARSYCLLGFIGRNCPELHTSTLNECLGQDTLPLCTVWFPATSTYLESVNRALDAESSLVVCSRHISRGIHQPQETMLEYYDLALSVLLLNFKQNWTNHQLIHLAMVVGFRYPESKHKDYGRVRTCVLRFQRAAPWPARGFGPLLSPKHTRLHSPTKPRITQS